MPRTQICGLGVRWWEFRLSGWTSYLKRDNTGYSLSGNARENIIQIQNRMDDKARLAIQTMVALIVADELLAFMVSRGIT